MDISPGRLAVRHPVTHQGGYLKFRHAARGQFGADRVAHGVGGDIRAETGQVAHRLKGARDLVHRLAAPGYQRPSAASTHGRSQSGIGKIGRRFFV